MFQTVQIWFMRASLAVLAAIALAALAAFLWRILRRRLSPMAFFGFAVLTVVFTIYGGSKPPAKRDELVIIAVPLGDGMYSTRVLHVSKDVLDKMKEGINNGK